MTKAVCSGSFDPVTNGHLDIFTRASAMFDELVVCVFHNIRKQGLFSVSERLDLLKEATAELKNVSITSFDGLLTDFLLEHNINIIVRGLRSVTDLEYEKASANVVHHLYPQMETIFLLTDPRYGYISSSAVRELASFGAPVSDFVPVCVEKAIMKKMAK